MEKLHSDGIQAEMEGKSPKERIVEPHAHSIEGLLLDRGSLSTKSEGTDIAAHDQQTFKSTLSLPYELLLVVFNEAPIDPNQRTCFVTSVAQVSYHWREAALETPFLWSGIYLQWRAGGEHANFLPTFLRRSRSHALDIELDLRRYSLEEDHGVSAQLDILIPETSRWRTFTYNGHHPSDVFEIMEPLAHLSVPILESFYLSVIWSGRNDIEQLDIFGRGAPMLTHVHISGMQPISCLPPCSSLTFLHLAEPAFQMEAWILLEILRSSTVLVSLELDGVIVDPISLYILALEGEEVELASLRHFSFTAVSPPKYYLQCILNSIRCPGLESMVITDYDSLRGVQNITTSQDLTLPKFPALRIIELNGVRCNLFIANFDFTKLPALDTISLMDCVSPMALLSLLLPSKRRVGNDSIWPLLRVIKLNSLGGREFDALCKIISHRHACGRPIEAVELDSGSLDRFPHKVNWMRRYVVVRRGSRILDTW